MKTATEIMLRLRGAEDRHRMRLALRPYLENAFDAGFRASDNGDKTEAAKQGCVDAVLDSAVPPIPDNDVR